MVFAARKKQLIAIQFKYFGRAYNTEQKSFRECDAGTTQSFLDEHPKPQGLDCLCDVLQSSGLTSNHSTVLVSWAEHRYVLHDFREDRNLPTS